MSTATCNVFEMDTLLESGLVPCRTEFVHPQVVQMESKGDPIVLGTDAVLGEEEDGDGIRQGEGFNA